jgi:drug/metabolite transporter (DMT)-like permease
LGEFAALFTVLCWTTSAHAFESASKRVGSLSVNLIRLYFGFVFLILYSLFFQGKILPLDASSHNWVWLSVSGIIGFVIGDYCLFRAFAVIGARISMLIMASVPPLTAIIGWTVLGETLTARSLLGMGLTILGICIVVLERHPDKKNVRFSHPVTGILLALGGALGQAVGLVLSKYGIADYNAFSATQIRVIAAVVSFSIVVLLSGRWPKIKATVRDKKVLIPILVGAFFGLFLGVTFSLLAVQHTSTGVASTIISIVPVTIIVPAVIFYKEKVTLKEIFGAVVAVLGVSLLFL